MAFPPSKAMAIALDEAKLAAARDEVPVGAVITDASGKLLAAAGNRTRELTDPTAHAEMLVIREACRLVASERLIGCTITVTLEPCAMCAAAIAAARLSRVVYGASDPKSGGVEHGARVFSHSHHQPEVIAGVAGSAATILLRDFFAGRRD
jgi:tRNA(adenine34) deaminase